MAEPRKSVLQAPVKEVPDVAFGATLRAEHTDWLEVASTVSPIS